MNMQNNGEKTDGGIVVYFDKEQREDDLYPIYRLLVFKRSVSWDW